jgi:adenosylhomocysteine nucleosidase
MTLAVVSAMPEEQAGLLDQLQSRRSERHAGRSFHLGLLAGVPVCLVLSGIGKVAAAATTGLLLERFGASAVLFTGVAGGLAGGVGVGDIVIGERFLQHDLDVSPLFPRWEVPGSGLSRFAADAALTRALFDATAQAAAARRCHRGTIVSGDRFVSSAAESARLQAELPEALAVDMESAAVAQVCADFNRPLAVMRSISDRADDAAHVDFQRFLAEVAAPLARAVVLEALPRLAAAAAGR